LKAKIFKLIEANYSPEQVNGFMKKNNNQTLSHETIYNLIWRDKNEKGIYISTLYAQEGDIENENQVRIREVKSLVEMVLKNIQKKPRKEKYLAILK
jgi:IS30 family transposase